MNIETITYIDKYIANGQKSIIGLRHLYDTALLAHHDKRDHIIRIPVHDFFIKYRDQLSLTTQWYNVPVAHLYKPKSVSLDLYDTTELWLSLMRLNSFRNITEFDQLMIMVYNPIEVKELISIFFKREKKIT